MSGQGVASVAASVLERLGRLYPWPVTLDDETREAYAVLPWQATPADVIRGGYATGLVVAIATLPILLMVPATFRLLTALSTISLALLAVHCVHSIPRLWSTARRTSALGAAPDLVSRAVLRMRLSPAPERAARFAAESDRGLLATSLGRHVRQSKKTAQSGLQTFGESWADLFPALRRSLALVTAAGQAPAADRDQLLDRAMTVVLDGTREQMQTFAGQIQTPATMLYAFGVLLPTALVALLPAAGAAGLPVTPVTVSLLYALVLPAILVTGAAWVIARRPVAFPPPNVTTAHPGVTDPTCLALGAGLAAGVLGWLVAARLFLAWGPPIAALGLGVGVALWLQYRQIIGVYERIRAVEAGLADALALIGRRVANGAAIETAIEQAAAELDGETGAVLARGATQQRQLKVGVHEAFLGRHGILNPIPSARVRGSMALVALAANEGRPAGSALLALADHVDDLREIEREARHSMAHVCRTLSSTGTVFGPLVAGATVALADSMGTLGALPGGGNSLGWLGGPVGLYVLILATVLTALATALTRGFDRSLVGYRVGRAIVCSTVTYFAAIVVVGLVA
jgi:hypothetical protein